MALCVPVARDVGGIHIFAIPKSTEVSMIPGAWERLCRMMKGTALKIYIQHRLSGKTEITTLDAMMSSMKESEMFGKTDMLRARES